MWIILDQTNPTPLYEQIANQIAERILSGELPPGSELPSIRQLAADLVISVITTKRAYQELEAKGLIITRPGVGSTVAAISAHDRQTMRAAEIKQLLVEVVERARRLDISDDALMTLLRQVLKEGEGA